MRRIRPYGRRHGEYPNRHQGGAGAPAVAQTETVRQAGAPDLKIEYVGFNSPANDQLVDFKITSIGKGASSATTARVVTSMPEPTPWLRELDVPVLKPGASVVV